VKPGRPPVRRGRRSEAWRFLARLAERLARWARAREFESLVRDNNRSRTSERGEVDLGAILILAACAILLVVCLVWRSQAEEACERKGGTYYCAYKSSCLCLAKGTVLP
jgi:ferric-dicitrate binding protein FerR (iron transport regulator)